MLQDSSDHDMFAPVDHFRPHGYTVKHHHCHCPGISTYGKFSNGCTTRNFLSEKCSYDSARSGSYLFFKLKLICIAEDIPRFFVIIKITRSQLKKFRIFGSCRIKRLILKLYLIIGLQYQIKILQPCKIFLNQKIITGHYSWVI